MKALEILQALSRESVSSEQFGIAFVGSDMPYNEFVEVFLSHDYKHEDAYAKEFVSGYFCYCYSSSRLALRSYYGVREHVIKNEYLYVVKVDL